VFHSRKIGNDKRVEVLQKMRVVSRKWGGGKAKKLGKINYDSLERKKEWKRMNRKRGL